MTLELPILLLRDFETMLTVWIRIVRVKVESFRASANNATQVTVSMLTVRRHNIRQPCNDLTQSIELALIRRVRNADGSWWTSEVGSGDIHAT
jgi:hypothetical protein